MGPVIAQPPYALAPLTFRFRALVALAERLPIGGEREVMMGLFVVARLYWDAIEPGQSAATASRAAAARQWLQTLALPSPTRVVFQQALEAAARGEPEAMRSAWGRVLALASRGVATAQPDLVRLSERLATLTSSHA